MKFYQEWSAAIKMTVLVISSWVAPPLLMDIPFARNFIVVIYLAFLGGIIHLAGAIHSDALKRGQQQMQDRADGALGRNVGVH